MMATNPKVAILTHKEEDGNRLLYILTRAYKGKKAPPGAHSSVALPRHFIELLARIKANEKTILVTQQVLSGELSSPSRLTPASALSWVT